MAAQARGGDDGEELEAAADGFLMVAASAVGGERPPSVNRASWQWRQVEERLVGVRPAARLESMDGAPQTPSVAAAEDEQWELIALV